MDVLLEKWLVCKEKVFVVDLVIVLVKEEEWKRKEEEDKGRRGIYTTDSTLVS